MHALQVLGGHGGIGHRLAALVHDLEAHVKLEAVEELGEGFALRALGKRREGALLEHVQVVEESAQEPARVQLSQQVREKLEAALAEEQPRRVVVRLGGLHGLEKVPHQARHELRLVRVETFAHEVLPVP